MDWVEKLLHVSPDHGNGSLELAIYFVLMVIAAVAVSGFVRVASSSKRRQSGRS